MIPNGFSPRTYERGMSELRIIRTSFSFLFFFGGGGGGMTLWRKSLEGRTMKIVSKKMLQSIDPLNVFPIAFVIKNKRRKHNRSSVSTCLCVAIISRQAKPLSRRVIRDKEKGTHNNIGKIVSTSANSSRSIGTRGRHILQKGML